MSSKSSKKKKKKKLQRYYKNGKNVYPYAKASRILWSSGFAVTIFVGIVVVSQLILFLLQKLALKIQGVVGFNSKLGKNLDNFIYIKLPLGGILKPLLAVLLFIVLAYLVTIAFRHHEGELQPLSLIHISLSMPSALLVLYQKTL